MSRPLLFVILVLLCLWPDPTLGSDAEVLRPRVPSHVMEEARGWTNPVPATEENIEKGKA